MDILTIIQGLAVAGACVSTLCILGLAGWVVSLFIYAYRHPATQLGN